MDYTLEDLRGKYVKVGTPEAEIFLNACEKLGVGWNDFIKASSYTPALNFIIVGYDGYLAAISHNSDFNKFIPKPSSSAHDMLEPRNPNEHTKHLQWIYKRLVNIHGENPNYDYMLRLAEIAGIKSERELFIDKAIAFYDGRTGLSETAMSLAAGILFNAGCRFTESN